MEETKFAKIKQSRSPWNCFWAYNISIGKTYGFFGNTWKKSKEANIWTHCDSDIETLHSRWAENYAPIYCEVKKVIIRQQTSHIQALLFFVIRNV